MDDFHRQLELMSDLNQALNRTERLFRMKMGIRTPRPALAEFGEIMADLCRREGVEVRGAVDLRELVVAMERLGQSGESSLEVVSARRCLDRYLGWLRLHFSEAFTPSCQLPSAPPESHCERCGQSPATFHITQISPDGILRRDLCELCSREEGLRGPNP